MADKSTTFSQQFHGYLFGAQTPAGPFSIQPYAWYITIHEATNNPNGAALTDDWLLNTSFRKSAASVTSWQAVGGNFANGVSNQSVVSFDYVPDGDSWSIVHYIVWAVSDNGGSDEYHPVYTGTFSSAITLTSLQVLQFSAGNFVINP